MRRSSGKRRKSRAAAGVPDYRTLNLTMWDRTAASYERRFETALRREGGKAWGVFRVPERQLHLLEPVRGKHVLELGCGAADWSIALARDGARVVGLDFSERRLSQARERMVKDGVTFPLVRARAEKIPYPDDSFDLVLSDYGATTFSNPSRWVPEVARVLRPGGILVFAHASPLRSLTYDLATDRYSRTFARDYFGLNALRDNDSVQFQLPYGAWIRLFSSSGLAVERLVEPRAPRSWRSPYLAASDQRWARHWPFDAIWKLRKVRSPRARSRARD